MKVILVLGVLFASVFGDELNLNPNGNSIYKHQGNPSQPLVNLLSNAFDVDENGVPTSRSGHLSMLDTLNERPEMMISTLRGQLHPQPEQQHTQRNNEQDHSSLGYWATYPDAAAFDAKIKTRLSSSRILADKPVVLRKITQLAEQKFNQCKGLVEDKERACLGQSTGQIMQLVAAVENINRSAARI